MNFYKVKYDVGGSIGKTLFIMAEADHYIPLEISSKDSSYRLNSKFCKVTESKEIGLDEVKLSDLSVRDLLVILRLEKDGSINE